MAEVGVEIAYTPLTIGPIGLKAANAYVTALHRHHKASKGHKFSVAVRDQSGELRGVAIASRPRAQKLDDDSSLEVVRVCTDGTPNACSMLYGAIRRVALAMGYEPHRIFTYTLRTEPGTSLRAAGWHQDGETRGGEWSREGREREAALIPDPKVRWRAAQEPVHTPGEQAMPMTTTNCGRIDDHDPHTWTRPRSPFWPALTYDCPGPPQIEGGWATWDAEQDAAEERAIRDAREVDVA